MLYFNFKNYEEFKEMFGIVEHGNGVKSRKNKIMLAMYKDKQTFKNIVRGISAQTLHAMWTHASERKYDCLGARNNKNFRHWSRVLDALGDRYTLIPKTDLAYGKLLQPSLVQLKPVLFRILNDARLAKDDARHTLNLDGQAYFSDMYETDCMNGLCEDGTLNAIRYRNVEKGRVFKMKAGKMFNHILSCNKITSTLPEQIQRWLSEEFVAEWIEYARANTGTSEYTLHVDDNFHDIYTSSRCAGYDTDYNSFRSCMVGDGQWTFYRDAVDAKAAYLTDADGMIVARCIVFTNVHEDGSDKVWRLAERQYSRFGEYQLQRQLVAALIQGGHIDGYKSVGASCGDANDFVDNDGNTLEDKRFYIPCRLEDGDTISYQDSFKWYDSEEQIADNYENGTIDLSTTDSTVSFNNHDDDHWSVYNDEWLSDDDAYYVETREDYFYRHQVVYARVRNTYNGRYREEDCFEEDCIYIGGEYYYAGAYCEDWRDYGIAKCPKCGEYFIPDDGYYSELTCDNYCCEDCFDEAEREWHENNGDVYSEYDEEWMDRDDVIVAVQYHKWSPRGYETTISRDTFNALVDDFEATEYGGKFYIDSVTMEGEPVHLAHSLAA